jgi:hypothetical protein
VHAAAKRRQQEALSHELQAGEHVTASAAAMSDPSRLAAAVVLAAAFALTAAGLASLLGPWLRPIPGSAVIGVALPVLGLGIAFLSRPVYVAVTNRRLICWRLSRARGTSRQPALAAPLADLRIVSYRAGRHGTSIRCEIPGHRPIRLDMRRAGCADFAEVDAALARSGAFTRLDPPYPTVAES